MTLPTLNQKNQSAPDQIRLTGRTLTIDQLVSIARAHVPTMIDPSPEDAARMEASCAFVERAVSEGRSLYGVTTGFGGMASVNIDADAAAELQRNMLIYHKCGAGPEMPVDWTRAAMAARANAHLQGASGIRRQVVERLAVFLNHGITPIVPQFGSIGASGDLVPLSYVAGTITAADRGFKARKDDRQLDAVEALSEMGLEPINLRPKEALALLNGSSFSAAAAAMCLRDAQDLMALTIGLHGLFFQAYGASPESLAPFVHDCKPHPGQVQCARALSTFVAQSKMCRTSNRARPGDLEQDRYSLRCAAQFIGPLVDTLVEAQCWIERELNSVSDNPLINTDQDESYYCGNFLGQYVGLALDRVRHAQALSAKHLDIQVAWLMQPEFSGGLPSSLVGNPDRPVNMGMKGLQLTCNSLAPMIAFHGQPLVDRFPSHAEQFNQNLNSQSMGSALLTNKSLELSRHLVAATGLVAVQGVDLRARMLGGTARDLLSPASVGLYQSLRDIAGRPDDGRPLVFDDNERPLDLDLAALNADLSGPRKMLEPIRPIADALFGERAS